MATRLKVGSKASGIDVLMHTRHHVTGCACTQCLPRRRRVGGLRQGAEGGSRAGRDICLPELLPGWAKPDVSFSRPSPPAPASLEAWSSALPRLPPRGIGYSACGPLHHSHGPPPAGPARCRFGLKAAGRRPAPSTPKLFSLFSHLPWRAGLILLLLPLTNVG